MVAGGGGDRAGVATLVTRLPSDSRVQEAGRDFVPMTYTALGGAVAPRATGPGQVEAPDRGSVEVVRGATSGPNAGAPGAKTTPQGAPPMPYVEPKPDPRSAPPGAHAVQRAGPGPSANPLATRVDIDAILEDDTVTLLREEIGAIRRMVGQLVTQSRSAGAQLGVSFGAQLAPALGAPVAGALGSGPSLLDSVGMAQPLFDLCLRLQDVGVRHELVDDIVGLVRDELTPDELRDAGIVRTCVERHLAATMPVVGVASKAGPRPGIAGPRPLTLALVGPTGVGKTTTIAKLAAAYKLRYGASVGLITSDTYRIAAVEQLRTYANIIGLPLKVCLTPQEVAEACESLRGCDVVLMDSAGRSQHDATRLDELAGFVLAAEPDEVHLVLSAGASPEVLQDAAVRFAALGPTALMVTKLDEAVRFGMLPGLCKDACLRLSYVTTGQEVPEHIELANPQRLARLVLDGKLRA
jgi:signal recognition particle GTPase